MIIKGKLNKRLPLLRKYRPHIFLHKRYKLSLSMNVYEEYKEYEDCGDFIPCHVVGSSSIAEKINGDICLLQGRIYRYAAELGYNTENFSAQYLNSKFCNDHFDSYWSPYHNTNAEYCFSEFMEENPSLQKNPSLDPEFSSWIGFTFAQLHIETGLPSRELALRVDIDFVERLYVASDSYSIGRITDEICEKFFLTKLN